jgi:hypothetical protein
VTVSPSDCRMIPNKAHAKLEVPDG